MGEIVLICTVCSNVWVMSKKCCRTILFAFQGLIYPLYNSVCLFYRGMPLPEAEFMIWY
jgi:hypothetical protein